VDSIIDAHGHLGDILHPGGGRLIDETGVTKEPVLDLADRAEKRLHQAPRGIAARIGIRLLQRWITRGQQARNATATLENFRRSLDEAEISHAVCLPIPPNVTFADLERATRREPRIIPFSGVDYTADGDPGSALAADVAAGARGLKLHPIIQKVPLTSESTRAAVESFAVHDLPVLLHCGIFSYYLGAERAKEEPGYGAIRYAAELVRDFPNVKFIAGHSGLYDVDDALRLLDGFPNVWVDTSFQSVARVRELLETFGPERVLFGSDWPWGNRPPALAIVREACRNDRGVARRILFENAAELLRIG
jgi:predicted TIM-barrel fold metal-dependent hydrolase